MTTSPSESVPVPLNETSSGAMPSVGPAIIEAVGGKFSSGVSFTIISTQAVPVAPSSSVTTKVTVYVPGAVYV